MTVSRLSVTKPLRLLTLAAALAGGIMALPTYADEYADVSQLLRAGKLNDALSKADQYLQSKPRDPQMRFIKGVIFSESGKPNDAIATFTKLTEDYPELPEPYNNLAVLYASQNQLDKARTALEMAIRTNPSYATAHENLGDVYAKLASQAYSKALQLDANNQAVQPKLSLIRELFAPAAAKGGKPVATPPVPAPTPSQAPVTKPAPAPSPMPAPTPAPVPVAKPVPAPTPIAPVFPATSPAPAPSAVAAAAGFASKDVESAVISWARAWSSKDMSGYLGAYGRDFDPPGNMSRQNWEEERRKRILGKSSISVKVRDLSVTVKGNSATARFRQDYSGGAITASVHKTLEMVKTGDRWVIVKEQTGS